MVSEAAKTEGIGVRPITVWRGLPLLGLIFLLMGMALIAWLAGTRHGAQTAFQLLNLVTAGQIQATDFRGSFLHQLQIGQLTITTPEGNITIRDLRLDWQPLALTHRLLHIDRLHIAQLTITASKPSITPPHRLPASLQLPIDVLLDRCEIDRLSLRQYNQAQAAVEAIVLSWQFEKTAHALRLQSAHLIQIGSIHTDSDLKAHFHLQASSPFVIQSDIQLQGMQHGRPLEAKGRVSGALKDMAVEIALRLDQPPMQTQVSVQAQLQPFAEQRLSAVELKAEQLNLSHIKPNWPTTQMAVSVTLDPKTTGTFSIRNTLAGTWDQSLLPVKDASGRWYLQDDSLIVEDVHINRDHLAGKHEKTAGSVANIFAGKTAEFKKYRQSGAQHAAQWRCTFDSRGRSRSATYRLV